MTADIFEIRRVLIGLDSEMEGLDALESAADLAVHLQAELAGLFVEDKRLLALEQHPIAKEIDLLTGYGEEVQKGGIERDLRAFAANMEHQLREMSSQRQIDYSFNIRRGGLAGELSEICSRDDLIVIESAGRKVTDHVDFGTSAVKVVQRVSESVLFLRRGIHPPHSIIVGFDGSTVGHKALDAALQFASRGISIMTVMLLADTEEEAETYRRDIEPFLSEFQNVRYHRITGDSAGEITHISSMMQGDLVVLPDSIGAPSEDFVGDLLDATDVPVLFVR